MTTESNFNWRNYITLEGFDSNRNASIEALLDGFIARTGKDGEDLIKQAYDTQLNTRRSLLGTEPAQPKIRIFPKSLPDQQITGSPALADPIRGDIFLPESPDQKMVLYRASSDRPFHQTHEVQALIDELAGLATNTNPALELLKKVTDKERKEFFWNALVSTTPELSQLNKDPIAPYATRYEEALSALDRDPSLRNRFFPDSAALDAELKKIANREDAGLLETMRTDLQNLENAGFFHTILQRNDTSAPSGINLDALAQVLIQPPTATMTEHLLALEQSNDALADLFITRHYPELTARGDYLSDAHVLLQNELHELQKQCNPRNSQSVLPVARLSDHPATPPIASDPAIASQLAALLKPIDKQNWPSLNQITWLKPSEIKCENVASAEEKTPTPTPTDNNKIEGRITL